MPALPEETPMHAKPGLSQTPQRVGATGLVHHRKQAIAELHRLDETPGGQPERQRDLQPPNVSGGTGVRQHRNDQTPESIQLTGQKEGTGPMAVVLPGA